MNNQKLFFITVGAISFLPLHASQADNDQIEIIQAIQNIQTQIDTITDATNKINALQKFILTEKNSRITAQENAITKAKMSIESSQTKLKDAIKNNQNLIDTAYKISFDTLKTSLKTKSKKLQNMISSLQKNPSPSMQTKEESLRSQRESINEFLKKLDNYYDLNGMIIFSNYYLTREPNSISVTKLNLFDVATTPSESATILEELN